MSGPLEEIWVRRLVAVAGLMACLLGSVGSVRADGMAATTQFGPCEAQGEAPESVLLEEGRVEELLSVPYLDVSADRPTVADDSRGAARPTRERHKSEDAHRQASAVDLVVRQTRDMNGLTVGPVLGSLGGPPSFAAPEPTTLMLYLEGLMVLWLARRLRRASRRWAQAAAARAAWPPVAAEG